MKEFVIVFLMIVVFCCGLYIGAVYLTEEFIEEYIGNIDKIIEQFQQYLN